MTKSAGIHHITAIAGEPKRHVAFYTRTLGLRFVKRTVNFDDPGTWHLYYGDEVGAPGTAPARRRKSLSPSPKARSTIGPSGSTRSASRMARPRPVSLKPPSPLKTSTGSSSNW